MCLWNKNISNCFDYRFVVIYDDTSAALYTDDGNDVDDEEEIMLKFVTHNLSTSCGFKYVSNYCGMWKFFNNQIINH